MKISQVQQKAKEVGVKAARLKKPDLIRSIQQAEGNVPCFGAANGSCAQADCLWREDCLSGE